MSLKVKYILKDHYTIIKPSTIDRAINIIRQRKVTCILVHVNGQYETTPNKISRLKSNFPTIPIIGIVGGTDLEMARKCGEAGVDFIIADYDLKILWEVMDRIISLTGLKINWNELGINTDNCSHIVQDALRILREHYLQLHGVREIAHELEIAPETLSREFKKYCLIGPKRLLTILKIKHAIYLLQNPGLSIKEIGTLVGYSDKRRFSESFFKQLHIYPEYLRSNYNDMNEKLGSFGIHNRTSP